MVSILYIDKWNKTSASNQVFALSNVYFWIQLHNNGIIFVTININIYIRALMCLYAMAETNQ